MRIDMFRRPESNGRYSYLVVPQGRAIPEEAANTDWELTQQGVELANTDMDETGIGVDEGERQIDDKGYAITHADPEAGNTALQ